MEKRTKKKKNLFFLRFYIVSGLVIMAAFIVFGLMTIAMITMHWWNEKMDMLNDNSESIATDYINAVYRQKNDLSTLLLGNDIQTISEATEADYFICDTSGKIIVCKEFLETNGRVCPKHSAIEISADLVERARLERFSSFRSLDDNIRDSFVVAMPIVYAGTVVGEVFAVEDAVQGLLPYVGSMFKMVFYAFLVALLVAYIIIYFYSRRITKPIGDMIEATSRYAKGDFTYHVNAEGSSQEMVNMAEAMNKMVDELAIDDKAKKSFVANVSHELKTPMTTIGGFVDGILDGTIPKEKEEEYLRTVSNEVKRLSRLVVAMLNLSKIESGEISIKPNKYNVSSQIIEVLLSMEQRLNEKKINVDGLEDMSDLKIYADRDLLHQVIYNLLDNAVKFTPEGGTITFFGKYENDATTITIRNSGQGISDDEISRIFERFYKVDQSRSFDVKGVGLGLYIVKTIVNMHDGVIKADSKKGEYTEFTFTIPDYK